MASDNKPNVEEAYQKLRANFVQRLLKSAEILDRIFLERKEGAWTFELADEAMNLAHGLAGTGGLLGFPEITDQGKLTDKYLAKTLAGLAPGRVLNSEACSVIEVMLSDLRTLCRKGAEEAPQEFFEPVMPRKAAVRRNEETSVLIVDDDPTITEFIGTKLRQSGFRVLVANDGESALSSMIGNVPDLVILDISMPKMSGHEVLKKIKANQNLSAVPVLMLTANSEQDQIVSALRTGAIDYIVKPFDTEKLMSRVNKIMDASRFTVLVADNDALLLQLIVRKFTDQGFKVLYSEDGKDAWNQIFKYLPDLVILDRMMPGMEGLAILKNMRDERSTEDIPAIILSARSTPQDIERGLKMGAQAYITKPFQPQDLIAKSLTILAQNNKDKAVSG